MYNSLIFLNKKQVFFIFLIFFCQNIFAVKFKTQLQKKIQITAFYQFKENVPQQEGAILHETFLLKEKITITNKPKTLKISKDIIELHSIQINSDIIIDKNIINSDNCYEILNSDEEGHEFKIKQIRDTYSYRDICDCIVS